MSWVQDSPSLSGIGLVTGQESRVQLEAAALGQGIEFIVNGLSIPARPECVIDSGRGVTLGVMHNGQMQPLYIVEHFLSACSMRGVSDLKVHIFGAPELPLLDGSAQDWLPLLSAFVSKQPHPPLALAAPLVYQAPQNERVRICAEPSDTLEITYHVDFPHPDLQAQSWTWSPDQGSLESTIAPAQTFGFVSELPVLLAQGLAKGVTQENTLGLTETGYTRPLRFEAEPIRHKILDFLGDLMLCGIPATRLKGKFHIQWGGHTAHLAFGQLLAQQFGL